MRTKPIGTGPFKFVELKQNESMKVVRNPDYWKPGRPYLDAIEFTIIANRATSVLAFTAGKFDMTFTAEIAAPVLKDLKTSAPWAICEMLPTNTQANLLVNRDKPPFDDARIRKAMVLALDRESFTHIIGQGTNRIGGTMLPPPEGRWGMPAEFLATVAGYGADHEKARAEGRKIMGELGYSADKPLKIKVSTRNIATYRDQAVILNRSPQAGFLQGELEPLDTAVWYNRMARKDFTVGMNVQGVGIDDPTWSSTRRSAAAPSATTPTIAAPRSRSCSSSSRACPTAANAATSSGRSTKGCRKMAPGRSSSTTGAPPAGAPRSKG